MSEEQTLLACIIVAAFVALTVYQIIFRPDNIIMPPAFLVITTVAACFVFIEK
jgi:hypothetical protein